MEANLRKEEEKIKEIQQGDKDYPEKLKHIKNAPKKLYVMGNSALLNKPSIAIVGSRKASDYGKKYTALFANRIACSNICVVSGLALGIDKVAHKSAMQEEGKTIAVIASGFSHIFPQENIPLFHQILENGGCIVSEYPPNTKPIGKAFPIRNRIIAGLSMAVLVMEAAYRSGSSITAKYALEQKKEVFCIPHALEDKQGVGCNRLLKQGAKIITDVTELEDYIGIPIQKNSKNNTENLLAEELEKEYQPIYKLLTERAHSSNELAKKLQWPISRVNQVLTIMEMKGYIEALPANEFQRKEKKE